jgi:hypothetical protein
MQSCAPEMVVTFDAAACRKLTERPPGCGREREARVDRRGPSERRRGQERGQEGKMKASHGISRVCRVGPHSDAGEARVRSIEAAFSGVPLERSSRCAIESRHARKTLA